MIVLKSKWLLAVVSGLMMTAAFPKINAWLLAWVAMVPLLVALRELPAKEAFRVGMVAGLAHYLTLLYWVVYTMRTYGYLPWWQCVALLVLLAAYLAVYWGAFAAALVRFCQRPLQLLLFVPVFWLAFEYLRSFMLTGFPWGTIGYSQSYRLHIVQISDMFGVYGVSFVVLFCNAAVFLLVLNLAGKPWLSHTVSRWQSLMAVTSVCVLIGLVMAYGNSRLKAIDAAMAVAPAHRVAVVQGNIDQARKWDPAFQIGTTKKYVRLTRAAATRKPDLVVWPETATPFYFSASPKLTRLVTDTVRQTGIHLLVGSPSVQGAPGSYAYYNSAYMVTPDGRIGGRYDKVHLVPFGEYVPLKPLLWFVGKMVAQVGDFTAGEKGRTLTWGDGLPSIGVQICFEIIFPGLSRSLVNNDAGLLVNLTNDAWFDRSSAAYQHFSMAVFRAVENRRSLIRCANTGISGFIDPAGRIMAQTGLFEDAVIDQTVPSLNVTALYTRTGDLMPAGCLITLIVLTGRIVMRRNPNGPDSTSRGSLKRFKQLADRLVGKRR